MDFPGITQKLRDHNVRKVLDHMQRNEAEEAVKGIYEILNWDGVAFLTFDEYEESDKELYVELGDDSRRYVKGKQRGMIWRYYTNREIRRLLGDFSVLKFDVKEELNVKKDFDRVIWAIK